MPSLSACIAPVTIACTIFLFQGKLFLSGKYIYMYIYIFQNIPVFSERISISFTRVILTRTWLQIPWQIPQFSRIAMTSLKMLFFGQNLPQNAFFVTFSVHCQNKRRAITQVEIKIIYSFLLKSFHHTRDARPVACK